MAPLHVSSACPFACPACVPVCRVRLAGVTALACRHARVCVCVHVCAGARMYACVRVCSKCKSQRHVGTVSVQCNPDAMSAKWRKLTSKSVAGFHLSCVFQAHPHWPARPVPIPTEACLHLRGAVIPGMVCSMYSPPRDQSVCTSIRQSFPQGLLPSRQNSRGSVPGSPGGAEKGKTGSVAASERVPYGAGDRGIQHNVLQFLVRAL